MKAASEETVKDTLPDKLSDLAELALADLNWAKRQPNYRVNMTTWHRTTPANKLCYVCLAGAVMAHTLEIPQHHDVMPADFPPNVGSKLLALDYLRKGLITDALNMLPRNDPARLGPDAWYILGRGPDVWFVKYDKDPDKWEQWMRATIELLREHGC